MIILNLIKLILIQTSMSRVISDSNEDEKLSKKISDDEKSVLASVYNTMNQNYESKLSQNLETVNFISDFRNKSKTNEVPMLSTGNKNHRNIFPFGIQSASRIHPIELEDSNQARADHGEVTGHDE